jgi:hypothetical protein
MSSSSSLLGDKRPLILTEITSGYASPEEDLSFSAAETDLAIFAAANPIAPVLIKLGRVMSISV